MPENRSEGVANEINRQNADREPASPNCSSRQSNRRQAARAADQSHQRDRPIPDSLKVYPRFWFQLPDGFQESAGKGQGKHCHETDQSAGRKEEDEQFDPERSMLPGGFGFQWCAPKLNNFSPSQTAANPQTTLSPA